MHLIISTPPKEEKKKKENESIVGGAREILKEAHWVFPRTREEKTFLKRKRKGARGRENRAAASTNGGK